MGYRLGSDEWSPLSPVGRLDLKHLGPGHYSLLVRAVNETGHWSDPIDVSFNIAWPWYLRGWAICLWTLLLTGAAWFAYSQIRDRMRLRQHIRMQEQLNEAKLVFFTNVSHEFRTPLTLIRGALEQLSGTPSMARGRSARRTLPDLPSFSTPMTAICALSRLMKRCSLSSRSQPICRWYSLKRSRSCSMAFGLPWKGP